MTDFIEPKNTIDPLCSTDVPATPVHQTEEHFVDQQLYTTQILDLMKEAEFAAADAGKKISVAYIYVIEAIGLKLFKIGLAKDMANRLPAYRTECPVPCRAI